VGILGADVARDASSNFIVGFSRTPARPRMNILADPGTPEAKARQIHLQADGGAQMVRQKNRRRPLGRAHSPIVIWNNLVGPSIALRRTADVYTMILRPGAFP
jgi:hypothetical protein